MGVANTYVCPRCGNTNPRYFGNKNGSVYCRLCITFQGKEAREYKVDDFMSEPSLDYPLSSTQQFHSKQLLENFKDNKSSLVYAVCGSGKTELVYEVISYALSNGMHVGFAVPRREVVIDLYPRFIKAYKNKNIVMVFGGHNSILEGDIVLLTTHQLYRYDKYFDLLILDEIDAFPFKDNTLLINYFHKSVKGNFIMMSATPPDDIVKYFKKNKYPILSLHTRYHRHPLPVPQVKIRIGYFKLFYLIKKINEYKSLNKQVMIFTSSIAKCEDLYHFLKIFVKRGSFVHSKCLDRKDKINAFKKREYDYLVTTSVLERGVTIKDVQVIIYKSDDFMYEKGVLVQISGRVGRKIDAPTGEVIFLANKKTKAMKEAINAIEFDNSFLTKPETVL